MKIIHTNERTAGLTSEAAVTAIGNRYQLVLVAARRMRELGRGDMPKIVTRNGHAVTAISPYKSPSSAALYAHPFMVCNPMTCCDSASEYDRRICVLHWPITPASFKFEES